MTSCLRCRGASRQRTEWDSTQNQRGRAIGLLRSVGATQGQVLGSLVIELTFIGAAATVVGLVVGVAGADVLGSWLDVGRYGLDDPPVVLSVRTALAAVVVGLGVTITALVLPARRLARAAPVTTLAGGQVAAPSWRRRRRPAMVAVGVGLAVVIWRVWSPSADPARNLVGLSIGGALVVAGLAVLVAGGATTLARWMARPMQTVLGAPGRLASANVVREPRRTSSALIALLVGVAVLASVGVVTRSIRSTVGGELERGAIADYFISGSMDPTVTASIGELPEVASAVGLRENAARVGGSTTDVTGTDLSSLPSVLDLGVEVGRVAPLEGPTVLLRDSAADRLDVRVGDRVPVQFDLGDVDFTVGAVFDTPTIAGDFIIDVATYDRLVSDDTDDLVLISAEAGVSDRAARTAISSVTATYPSLEFWDEGEYRAAREGEIDVVLRVLDALLGLAVAATLFGVVNTLGLAVLQRRREIGLLRAVGMTRVQVKVMVLGESAVISILGVVGGVGLGVGLGLVAAASLPLDLVATLVLPGRELAWIVLGGLTVGLAGSIGPATRAARVDILEAIAQR